MNHRSSVLAPDRARQRGVTIIELMVAMAIGLMIAAGLAIMFANSSKSSRDLESSTRQIENGRYAADLLAQELAMAGYYGDVPLGGAVYNAPDACATDVNLLGWDNATKKLPYPIEGKSYTELLALACVPNRNSAPKTTGVLIRRLDTVATPQAAIDNSLNNVYVQTSQCDADNPNTLFLISRSSADFTLKQLKCAGLADARRYLPRLYYVATCNECAGAAVDTIPTLKRVELQGAAQVVTPLVTGIERIALEYGFDVNNDGVPDTYLAARSGTAGAADNDWANVVAVRVYVVARATEQTVGYIDTKQYNLGKNGVVGPYNDGYKRKVFVSTAKINNVAGPREK